MGKSEIGPETQAASIFNLSFQASDFLLTVGRWRPQIDSEKAIIGGMLAEWIGAYALSPTTAAQLRDVLIRSIASYEEAFGQIPRESAQIGPAAEQAPGSITKMN
jgi:hypothetical protein